MYIQVNLCILYICVKKSKSKNNEYFLRTKHEHPLIFYLYNIMFIVKIFYLQYHDSKDFLFTIKVKIYKGVDIHYYYGHKSQFQCDWNRCPNVALNELSQRSYTESEVCEGLCFFTKPNLEQHFLIIKKAFGMWPLEFTNGGVSEGFFIGGLCD